MNESTIKVIRRIMENNKEHWFYIDSHGWFIVDLSDPMNQSEHAAIRIVKQVSTSETAEVDHQFFNAVMKQDWVLICEERNCFEEFVELNTQWNLSNKEERDRREREKQEREALLNNLFSQIPSYDAKQKHRLIIQAKGDHYKGVRLPEEVQSNSYRRHARCWNCHKYLDSYAELQCKACGWMLCKCGACGCGSVQQFYECPRCRIHFRHRDSFGQTPFCSWRCKSESLEDYSKYLASPHWKERRGLRLELDGNRCQDCGESATEVHHLTYERIGEEELGDLLSLCRVCHRMRHMLARLPMEEVDRLLEKLR